MGLLLVAWGGPGVASAQTPTTTIQNGSGAPRLELNYDGGLVVPGTFGSTTPADSIPATGAGTRLMWYPAKAAFRAGRVFDNTAIGFGVDGRTFWDPANVGNYSVAFGNNTQASGNMSLAAGINTVASGTNATALGAGTEASGEAATAMGAGTTASFTNATAMGTGTTASSTNATAMGEGTTASGGDATAMGSGTTASNYQTTAMGSATTARGLAATAMGVETLASGDAATAMGSQTTASGPRSMTMGYDTEASGTYAAAFGVGTQAIDRASTAMGEGTTAASTASLSTGECNSANATEDNTLLAVGNGSYDAFNEACNTNSDALVLDASGNLEISGSLTESSDRRLKTDIAPLGDDVLPALRQIRPVRYRFENPSAHPSGDQIGVIAQEVRKEFPVLVNEGSDGYLSLSYSKLTAVLLKGMQEQQSRLERQRSAIDSLRDRVRAVEALRSEDEAMKERLAALEADRSPSAAAGWAGSSAGLLLSFLLGGLLGAGLLWRRRM